MPELHGKPTDPKFQDLTGRTFGQLTVLAWHDRTGSNNGESRWRCLCTCGKEAVVWGGSLRGGRTISCGCAARSRASKQLKRHGMTGSLTHKSWQSMVARCTCKSVNDYAIYGGAGITVCERWRTFENFLADMGERPSKKHSIDRINSNGNYEPDNCRWATWDEQAANRPNTRLFTYNGETLSLSAWGRRIGLTRASIYYRLHQGWTMEQAITIPRGSKPVS